METRDNNFLQQKKDSLLHAVPDDERCYSLHESPNTDILINSSYKKKKQTIASENHPFHIRLTDTTVKCCSSSKPQQQKNVVKLVLQKNCVCTSDNREANNQMSFELTITNGCPCPFILRNLECAVVLKNKSTIDLLCQVDNNNNGSSSFSWWWGPQTVLMTWWFVIFFMIWLC
jgi:hypothetical protein